jgi:trehalose-6-phosphate synthase
MHLRDNNLAEVTFLVGYFWDAQDTVVQVLQVNETALNLEITKHFRRLEDEFEEWIRTVISRNKLDYIKSVPSGVNDIEQGLIEMFKIVGCIVSWC